MVKQRSSKPSMKVRFFLLLVVLLILLLIGITMLLMRKYLLIRLTDNYPLILLILGTCNIVVLVNFEYLPTLHLVLVQYFWLILSTLILFNAFTQITYRVIIIAVFNGLAWSIMNFNLQNWWSINDTVEMFLLIGILYVYFKLHVLSLFTRNYIIYLFSFWILMYLFLAVPPSIIVIHLVNNAIWWILLIYCGLTVLFWSTDFNLVQYYKNDNTGNNDFQRSYLYLILVITMGIWVVICLKLVSIPILANILTNYQLIAYIILLIWHFNFSKDFSLPLYYNFLTQYILLIWAPIVALILVYALPYLHLYVILLIVGLVY